MAVVMMLTLTAASAPAACGGGGEGRGAQPIELGMIVPLTGANAQISPYMRNGAQLAVDEINRLGGNRGRKLALRVEDDACDPPTAVAAARRMVAAKVAVSIGGYCSGSTLPTLQIFDSAGIPVIISAANSDELVAQHRRHVFLLNGTGRQQAAAALTWLSKEGAKRVVVIGDGSGYSTDIADLAAAGLRTKGPAVSAVQVTVAPGATGFGRAVRTVLRFRPDYVYWTGYSLEGGRLIRELRQAGYRDRIMVADGSADDKLVRIAGPAAGEGVLATMTHTPQTTQGAEGWIASYQRRFGSAPGPYSLQSYDTVRVAAEAIKKAGGTDGGKIVKALEGLNGFPLFSGPLKFTADHTLSTGGFVILVVKNGRFVLKDPLT